MTIGLLATGNELVEGDVLNTNGHFIANVLHSEGLPIEWHLTCGDEEAHIVESLAFLSKRCRIILVLGGLGPTSDDRTRFALSTFLNRKLTPFKKAYDHVAERLTHYKLEMTSGNEQQTIFPEGASLLDNPNGSAMGCSIESNDKMYYVLPGPPRECRPMFMGEVLPALKTMLQSTHLLLQWKLFGVPEGAISEKLDAAIAHLPCETGYRWEAPYIDFKVRCQPEIREAVENIIVPMIKPLQITTGEKTASEALIDMIASMKKPISIEDKATGGHLQSTLLTPSTFSYLDFNQDKQSPIHFKILGLTEYWQGKAGETTDLTLQYQNKSQQGSETRAVPFRGNVLSFATEWLSFRLMHLINQLH